MIEKIPDVPFEYWQLDSQVVALISSQGLIRSLAKNDMSVFTKVFWMYHDNEKEQQIGYLDDVNNCVVRKNSTINQSIFYILPDICKQEHFDKLAFSFDNTTIYLAKKNNAKFNFFPSFIDYFLLCGQTISVEYKKNSDLWKCTSLQSL